MKPTLKQHTGRGATLIDNRVLLQRQGCSTTISAALPGGGFVEARPTNNGRWRVDTFIEQGKTQHSTSFTYQSLKDGMRDALNRVELLTGHHYEFHPVTLSYMYGWISYPYQQDDLILSPVRYEPEDATIRNATNQIVVTLPKDGTFDPSACSGVDHVIGPLIDKVKRLGFHQCDITKGVDYCSRRFAWLLGEYLKEDGYLHCYALKQDMSTEAELGDEEVAVHEQYYGPTPLIAAMRCYVASKLGDAVDVPGRLL